MSKPKELYYEKRGNVLVKNLKSRHFEAYYCKDKAQALEKALEIIPGGASVGWGGAKSASEIGLLDAVRNGNYRALDRETCATPEERERMAMACLSADVFVTGVCGNCKNENCICNQILVTRNCRPANRICFLIVGEDLGF